MAMVHENSGMSESNQDRDLLSRIDKDCVLEASLVKWWVLAVSRDRLKLSSVHMKGVTASLHHTAYVLDDPYFTFIETNLLINTIHVEIFVVDCTADAHALQLKDSCFQIID